MLKFVFNSATTVKDILANIPAECLDRLSPGSPGAAAAVTAVARAFGEVTSQPTAEAIAVSIGKWNTSAAFLAALQLCPERLSPQEIREGVEDFLMHADAIKAVAELVASLDYEEN